MPEVTAPILDERYLRALRVEHRVVIGAICVCALGPLVLLSRLVIGTHPFLSVAPLLVFGIVSMVATWWTVRRFGADYVGGSAINTLLPILTILTVGSGVVVGSGLALFPGAAPWLALPGLPLVLGTVVFHDLGMRGLIHAWMRRMGFGRIMRVAVPVALSLMLTVSADREGTFVLPVAFAVGTLVNGMIREHVPGMIYLLVTPPLLLFASLLISG